MSRFKNLIAVMFLVFFVSVVKVKAVCDATEINKLNGLAVNVKASYEQVEQNLAPGEFTYPDGLTDEEMKNYVATYTIFRVYVTNLTEDLYIVVTNDVNSEEKTYTYENSNNSTIYFDWDDITKLVNYTITVYSSNKTNCADTKLNTLVLSLPRYNLFSEYDVCEGNEEFYLCHTFLAIPDNVSYGEFLDLIYKYSEGKVNKNGEEKEEEVIEEEKGFWEYVKEHKTPIILIVAGIIVVGGGTFVIIANKKRSNKNE